MIFLVVVAGFVAGVVLGMIFNVQIAPVFARYLSIGFLAAVDALLGGLKANLSDTFDELIFITGFLMNILFAVLIAYAGDRLGLELYIAVIVVFGIRIFQNLGAIRHLLIARYRNKAR